jgi:hypothetical protein
MKISVTQEHIEKGKRFSCFYCPVALAIRNKNFTEVLVNFEKLRIIDPTSRTVYYLPCSQSVKKFIHKFDLGKLVKPFNFILRGV